MGCQVGVDDDYLFVAESSSLSSLLSRVSNFFRRVTTDTLGANVGNSSVCRGYFCCISFSFLSLQPFSFVVTVSINDLCLSCSLRLQISFCYSFLLSGL